jgi:hypothetical protein
VIPVPQAPSADSIRAVLHAVFAEPRYQWTVQRTFWDLTRDILAAVRAFLDTLATNHPLTFFALLITQALIIVLMFTHIALVLRRALRRAPAEAAIPAVPLPPTRDAAWHLAQVNRLLEAGKFAEALGHRFLALVLELERRSAVTVRPSKTPAEYARELRLDDEARVAFAALVATLYAALFGGGHVDAAAFEAFDRGASGLVRHASIR